MHFETGQKIKHELLSGLDSTAFADNFKYSEFYEYSLKPAPLTFLSVGGIYQIHNIPKGSNKIRTGIVRCTDIVIHNAGIGGHAAFMFSKYVNGSWVIDISGESHPYTFSLNTYYKKWIIRPAAVSPVDKDLSHPIVNRPDSLTDNWSL